MNTLQIERILRCSPFTSEYTLGVFPSDRIPLLCTNPACFVSNTQPSSMEGEHWVAWYIKDNHAVYFCSYAGLPYSISYFENFIKSLSTITYSRRRVQGFLSPVCGEHCIYVLNKLCIGLPFSEIIASYNSPEENDRNVQKFARDLILSCPENVGRAFGEERIQHCSI